MIPVFVGVVVLLLAVTVVKAVQKSGNTPYFLAYFAVVLAGFYGMVSIGSILELLKDHPVEACLSTVIGVVSLKVAGWGLNVFKQMQMEA
jgi:hypothetical protein